MDYMMQKQTMFLVVAITGITFSDIMNSDFLQDIKLFTTFSLMLLLIITMINVPEQAEMAVDCLQDCSFKKRC